MKKDMKLYNAIFVSFLLELEQIKDRNCYCDYYLKVCSHNCLYLIFIMADP